MKHMKPSWMPTTIVPLTAILQVCLHDNHIYELIYSAAIYVGVLVFSGWQVAVNNSRSYQMI